MVSYLFKPNSIATLTRRENGIGDQPVRRPEKETSLLEKDFVKSYLCLLILGTASSRDDAMMAIAQLFFAAGSRS